MKKIFFFIVLFILSIGLIAQNTAQRRITGIVTDKTDGSSLPGVNIIVKGTYQGTASDINGEYSIMVPGGESVLQFSFIGYQLLEVQAGDQKMINISMSPETTALEEVIVTSQAKGQVAARSQQINSNTIKNVVAPDRLQENPDANAVEAIGRLPGISVLRGGGEGSALVVRGMEPKYTAVTLNGVQMASTSGSSRETNISGISQYILQEVEVYKALTADLEANSVGGTINMKLKETPDGLHYNAMVQMGYNHLNDYWGNYKLQGEASNRFFNNKLGVFFSANAERVNRSTQTFSAGYGLASTDQTDILLNDINLNNIQNIKYRRSAMLSLDYKIHPTTVLKLYGLYTNYRDDHQRQSKSYGVSGAGSVGYNSYYNPNRNTNIFQSTLSGETKLDFLNLELDYGVAYSKSKVNNPEGRSWGFSFDKASSSAITTIENRRLHPAEIVPMFSDVADSLNNLFYGGSGNDFGEMEDENLNTYLNVKIPYSIGDLFNGYLKFGGMYRKKTRFQDNTNAGAGDFYWAWKGRVEKDMPWLVPNGERLTANNMIGEDVDRFLKGQYDFGMTFDFDRLNEITDWWQRTTETYLNDPELLKTVMGGKDGLGYRYDLYGSYMNDQDITEDYYATYLMTELNVGRWLMLLPGVRYEYTNAVMWGSKVIKPTLEPMLHDPVNQTKQMAENKTNFFLPMMHARIKPMKSMYLHLAYTQTLSRPDFNAISPNVYINTGFQPFSYHETNPGLNPEFWTNYDAQLTVHGKKIGLFSVTGFYKSVTDKIWNRSYKRLKGEPVIDPFPDNSLVDVSTWENHQYPIYVKGAEFEVQTSFWYLPKPFSFFTVYANYTITDSETQYPTTKIMNIIPPGGGRPVPTRIDSVKTGPMLFQPRHIANASLGFNRKGLNVWGSFQYNGMIFTGKNYQIDEFDPLKEKFFRWDLQITQKLSKKLKGMELLFNFANLNDFMESSRLRGDTRPTYLENYGWTIDVGFRYRL
jgi:TonB-dependent receptor